MRERSRNIHRMIAFAAIIGLILSACDDPIPNDFDHLLDPSSPAISDFHGFEDFPGIEIGFSDHDTYTITAASDFDGIIPFVDGTIISGPHGLIIHSTKHILVDLYNLGEGEDFTFTFPNGDAYTIVCIGSGLYEIKPAAGTKLPAPSEKTDRQILDEYISLLKGSFDDFPYIRLTGDEKEIEISLPETENAEVFIMADPEANLTNLENGNVMVSLDPGENVKLYILVKAGNEEEVITLTITRNPDLITEVPMEITFEWSQDGLSLIASQDNVDIARGDTVELAAPEGDFSYQWYINGRPLPGANQQIFVFNSMEFSGKAYNVGLELRGQDHQFVGGDAVTINIKE